MELIDEEEKNETVCESCMTREETISFCDVLD